MTNPSDLSTANSPKDLRQELLESIDEAEWEWLQPHLERDSLVLVHSQLALVDVGIALAGDNAIAVQHWIAEALISKPSPEQGQTWTAQKRFQALIIQPYVLIQEL
ncbi:MAG: DUF2288 domain-containing protein [Synechococcales bacterium]|nr:DUF2288 domain-containing protein [Synechococcales bacterium]